MSSKAPAPTIPIPEAAKKKKNKPTIEELMLKVCSNELSFAIFALGCYDESLSLHPYQKQVISSPSLRIAAEKARQIGFSFTLALLSIVRAHVLGINAVFVSYNQNDSWKKIDFARQIWEGLPSDVRLPMKGQGSKSKLEFHRGNKVVYLESFPCKPSLGPTGADLYLDEVSTYMDALRVYNGSLPIVTQRPDARIVLCSTPLGQNGLFYDILRNPDPDVRKGYSEFDRITIPWWRCPTSLKHGIRDFKRASKECLTMSTEERVNKFASPQMLSLYNSMLEEGFQQEYECTYLDDSYAFFPYALLEKVAVIRDYENKLVWENGDKAIAGYDYGDVNDPSALWVWLKRGNRYITKYHQQFKKWDIDKQYKYVATLLMENPQIERLAIDVTDGGGRGLAALLKKTFGGKIVETSLSGPKIDDLMTLFKLLLEKGEDGVPMVELPLDRDILSQFHSIKKSISDAGRSIYKAERSLQRGHADEAYAAIIALDAENANKMRVRFFNPLAPSADDIETFKKLEKKQTEFEKAIKGEKAKEDEQTRFDRIMNNESAWR